MFLSDFVWLIYKLLRATYKNLPLDLSISPHSAENCALCILRQFGTQMFKLSILLSYWWIGIHFYHLYILSIFSAFSFGLRYFHLLVYFPLPQNHVLIYFPFKKYNKHSSVWTSYLSVFCIFQNWSEFFLKILSFKNNFNVDVIAGVPLIPPPFALHPPSLYVLICKLYALYLFFQWLPIYFNRLTCQSLKLSVSLSSSQTMQEP